MAVPLLWVNPYAPGDNRGIQFGAHNAVSICASREDRCSTILFVRLEEGAIVTVVDGVPANPLISVISTLYRHSCHLSPMAKVNLNVLVDIISFSTP